MLNRINRELEKQEAAGSLRRLVAHADLVDFSSNDYLGFKNSKEFDHMAKLSQFALQDFSRGAGGSRLLTGNSWYYTTIESYFASFFKAPSSLIFNSGYSANLGLLSAILKRNDIIFYDELSHSSIRDGIRLGLAKSVKFLHNNLQDLEKKISKVEGVKFVIVESIYSMDGDQSPLKEIALLCEKYDANLIVDEAHASGVFGKQGEGLVASLGLEKSVFARIHTFGKALGSHGAAVLGSEKLMEYLINFSRPFIYTTALPSNNLAAMVAGMEMSIKASQQRKKLFENITFFKKIAAAQNVEYINSESQIQGVIVPGNETVSKLSNDLRKDGFDVRAIRSPTVPVGSERLRICLHAFNSQKEIEKLLQSIKQNLNG